MGIKAADIVISLNGRDKGRLLFVAKAEGKYVSLVDGKRRKLIKPKNKSISHVRFIAECEPEIAFAINNCELSDKDLRRALAKFKSSAENSEGGTYVWQKTM